MKITNTMVLFYGSIFSQWYQHKMIIDDVEYNCCEQYMMANKALLFNDLEVWGLIMKTDDPGGQKALGKMVRNFDKQRWEEIARDFVYKANLAKFSDVKLKKQILDTGDKKLVEASPTDIIWGIGLDEEDRDALDKTKWKGTNWLGEVLMRVRDELNKTT